MNSSPQNNYKERFINAYMEEVIKTLDIADDKEKIERIRQLVEERYVDTELEIYNSDTYNRRYVDSTEFWFNRGLYILNENGVLFDTTERNESITAKLISQNIDIRQKFKKMKKDAAKNNDSINEKKYGTFEALTKLNINGFYGLSGYP